MTRAFNFSKAEDCRRRTLIERERTAGRCAPWYGIYDGQGGTNEREEEAEAAQRRCHGSLYRHLTARLATPEQVVLGLRGR